VLPAHFLRAFFVGLFGHFIRVGLFMWIGCLVRGRAGIIHVGRLLGHCRASCARLARWIILLFMCVIRSYGSHPLGHSLVPRFVRDLFVGCMWAFSFCPSLFSFMWVVC
jgi:hypothetical protein